MTNAKKTSRSAGGVLDSARDTVSDASEHPAVEAGARLGYAANAVMHLVIALIALRLAMGSYKGNADQSGALGMLAASTWGTLLLWVAVIGFVLLAVWQIGELVKPWAETPDRLKAAAKTIVYAALAWATLGFARHTGTSSKGQTVKVTKDLLTGPGGRGIVVLIGLVVIGVGAYHVYKGGAKKFLEDLTRRPSDWVVHAGRIGYIAKGIALAVAGLLFAQAGVRNNAHSSTGLDGAFRAVLEAPFGRAIVALVGLGFAAYAVYSFARAKYAKV